MTTIRQLLYFLGPRERKQTALLLVAMLIGAAFEAVGIGLIVPFIALVSNPEAIHQYAVLSWLYSLLQVGSTREFLAWCGAMLLALFIAKNLYLAFLLHIQYSFVFNRYTALARRLFDAYLRSPYTFHLQRNSAELLRNVNSEVLWSFNFVMLPVFNVAIESLVLMVVAVLLLYVEPLGALAALAVLGGFGLLFLRIVRRTVGRIGEKQPHYHAEMIKWVNQGVGGIKEAKVLNREEFFVAAHHYNSAAFSRCHRLGKTIGELPRLFLESIAVAGMLAIVLVMLARREDLSGLLPTLSLFAIAAIRIIPSMNRITLALTHIRHYAPAVAVVYNDLRATEAAAPDRRPDARQDRELPFSRAIELRNVSYAYPGAANNALTDVSLQIPKGHTIAFVGTSGAGKTTIVDTVLGLLAPTGGEILVDGIDIQSNLAGWQKKIGYIPQPIYLLDDSIRRNVAFGLNDEQIDDDAVWRALTAASLDEFVRSLPEQLDTAVGERGVRISGGQRQRIGIARALYHSPEILILDEATSALDNETEREITRAISALSREKTILVIAHRLSTVQHCDRLYLMKEGRIIAAGSYEELLTNSAQFQKMALVAAPDPVPTAVP